MKKEFKQLVQWCWKGKCNKSPALDFRKLWTKKCKKSCPSEVHPFVDFELFLQQVLQGYL